MAEMEAVTHTIRGILHALEMIDRDLSDLTEELTLSEPYLVVETQALTDVRGAIRLSFSALADHHLQFVRITQSRAGMTAADVLSAPVVIDQPVSPAAPLPDKRTDEQ